MSGHPQQPSPRRQRQAGAAATSRAGRSTRRRWLRRLAVACGGALVMFLLAFAYAYATIEIPDPNEGFQAQTSYVYYADGKTELGRFAEQNRTNVTLAKIPDHVENAVIAAEDRNFWTHQGIDPRGIVRAAFSNVRGNSTQGASTITQQYVKILYLSQDRTYTRKVKEAILSLKIQRQMSKQEILQGYLNTIYFGRGAYGVEAAAQAYFGKPAADLDVREGAVLAAVLNSPNNLDPAEGRAARRALRARYGYVIDGMERTGTLPARLAGTRQAHRLPELAPIRTSNSLGGQRGHVLAMVKQELVSEGFTEEEIYGSGLRVRTTFTRKAMAAAEQGVFEQRPDLEGLHVAVASVEPRTGALRGIFAGQDYVRSQFNWALEGGAPGSTFKPFALAAGLGDGYSLDSTFDGSSPLEVGGVEFNNQGEGLGRSYGPVSLLTATEESVNTAYVDLAQAVGARGILDTAVAMGIPRRAPGLEPTLGIPLGSATVSPVDMANAYGTIADGGMAKDWYVVDRVEDADGQLLHKRAVRAERAISQEVAADVSYALQQVTESGTGTNASTIGRPVAGKTGTATTDAGRVRSSWFVGYTPQLATAVMYVRGNGSEPLDGFLPTFYGGEYPARTWAATMSRALDGEPVEDFPEPAFMEQTVEDDFPAPTFAPEPEPEPSTAAPPPSSSAPTPAPTTPATPTEPATPSGTPSPTVVPTPTGGSGGAPAGSGSGGGTGTGSGGGTGTGGSGGAPAGDSEVRTQPGSRDGLGAGVPAP